MAQKPRRGGSIDDIDDPWALPKRDLGSWNLANPMNWAILSTVMPGFSISTAVSSASRCSRKKKRSGRRTIFTGCFHEPEGFTTRWTQCVFHYQNVWFPDTFINYWVIIASLSHFDPQISFTKPIQFQPFPWVRFGLVDSWIIFGAINRAIDSIARILPKFQNFIQLQPLS